MYMKSTYTRFIEFTQDLKPRFKQAKAEKAVQTRNQVMLTVYAGILLGQTKADDLLQMEPELACRQINRVYGPEIARLFETFRGFKSLQESGTCRMSLWRHMHHVSLIAIRRISDDFRRFAIDEAKKAGQAHAVVAVVNTTGLPPRYTTERVFPWLRNQTISPRPHTAAFALPDKFLNPVRRL